MQALLQQISTTPRKDDMDKVMRELAKLKEEVMYASEDIKLVRESVLGIQNAVDDFQQAVNKDIGGLKANFKWVEEQIAMLKKMMARIQDKMKDSGGKRTPTENHGGDYDAIIKQLQGDMHHLSQNMDKQFNNVGIELEDKASKKDLLDLEAKLLEKLNELLGNLGNQFADKDAMRKKIFTLEKNIKNLYDLMMAANVSKKDNEDDAMFTRKPLGPVSCASCDKGIVNLLGQQADYMPWKKMPFREPNERIAKYGQGFSKILGMMK